MTPNTTRNSSSGSMWTWHAMSSSDQEDDDRPIMAVDLDKTSMCNDREKVWADIGCVEGDPARRFGTRSPTILHPPKGARRFVSTASAANRRQSTEMDNPFFLHGRHRTRLAAAGRHRLSPGNSLCWMSDQVESVKISAISAQRARAELRGRAPSPSTPPSERRSPTHLVPR